VGVLLVAVPAALYLLAILIAESAPVASLVIYVGTIVLYFIAFFVDRLMAPPGAVEGRLHLSHGRLGWSRVIHLGHASATRRDRVRPDAEALQR
jgi:hypothetical protein